MAANVVGKKRTKQPKAARTGNKAARSGRPERSEHLQKLLMAVAASSTAMKLTAKGTPAGGKERELLQLPLKSGRVGVFTKAGVEALKANLARMIPEHAIAILQMDARPSTTLGEVAEGLGRLGKEAERGFDVVVAGPLREMRKQVGNAYGKVFAEKCSAGALSYLRNVGFGRESVRELGMAEAPLVLEMELSEFAGWTQMGEFKEKFLRRVGGMRSVMEKLGGAGTVEYCWLIESLRVRSGARVVAEVAAESGLVQIDLAQRLTREMNVCRQTLGVDAFRSRTGLSGAGVKIAILDGEVEMDHPGLAPRVVQMHNFVQEGFGNPDAHGTIVAGIAAGNHSVVGGVAPGATILNYKIFPTSGPSPVGDAFQGSQAIEMAMMDGAKVVNCSWGGGFVGDGTNRFAAASNRAWSKGVVVVKSAGNEGNKSGAMTMPADADGVIVVAATDRSGTRICDYSSRGPSANGKRPHLAAPGGEAEDEVVRSAIVGGDFERGKFGTSCAAPMVSGVVALLLEAEPGLTPDEVRERLVGMCEPLVGFDENRQGAGVLRLR